MKHLIAVCLVFLPSWALSADRDTEFRSPSGGIHCMISQYDGERYVRCDIMDATASYPRPKDCDLDWGHAYGIEETGKGYMMCAGDTIGWNPVPTIPYGSSISDMGFVCRSERTGMTCENGQGHGFTVSRKKQKLF